MSNKTPQPNQENRQDSFFHRWFHCVIHSLSCCIPWLIRGTEVAVDAGISIVVPNREIASNLALAVDGLATGVEIAINGVLDSTLASEEARERREHPYEGNHPEIHEAALRAEEIADEFISVTRNALIIAAHIELARNNDQKDEALVDSAIDAAASVTRELVNKVIEETEKIVEKIEDETKEIEEEIETIPDRILTDFEEVEEGFVASLDHYIYDTMNYFFGLEDFWFPEDDNDDIAQVTAEIYSQIRQDPSYLSFFDALSNQGLNNIIPDYSKQNVFQNHERDITIELIAISMMIYNSW